MGADPEKSVTFAKNMLLLRKDEPVFLLSYPNREVRSSFNQMVLECYLTGMEFSKVTRSIVGFAWEAFRSGLSK